jgi:hypothetical protein
MIFRSSSGTFLRDSSIHGHAADRVLLEQIENADADLVLAEEETLEMVSVMAKGVFMIHEKKVLVKGTFE